MLPYRTFTEISLGFINIQVWGLMSAIGVLLATLLAAKRAKIKHQKVEDVYDLTFYLLLSGLIGARILYVIENWGSYLSNPIEMLKFWNGGLSFSGGFLLAALVGYIYIRMQKLDFLKFADIFAPSLALGTFFGRVGCYLIGDHLGTPTDLPWAIMHGGMLTHPIILYELIYLGIIFFILIKMSKLRLVKGTLFTSFIIMYSVARFANDFLRIDPSFLGLTAAQYIMMFLFCGSILWYAIKK